MRYHELIELYKAKELSEQERQRVEQDIERQEAISEYLFEREEQETLELGFAQEEKMEHADQKADEFTAGSTVPFARLLSRWALRSVR